MTYTCVHCKLPIDGVMMGAGGPAGSEGDEPTRSDGPRFAHPDCFWRAEYKRVVAEVKDADSAWNEAIDRCTSIVSWIGQNNLVYDCHGRPVYQHYTMIAEMKKLLVARKEG